MYEQLLNLWLATDIDFLGVRSAKNPYFASNIDILVVRKVSKIRVMLLVLTFLMFVQFQVFMRCLDSTATATANLLQLLT